MAMFTVTRKDDSSITRTVDAANLLATCEELSPAGQFALNVVRLPDSNATTIVPPESPVEATPAPVEAAPDAPVNSTFTSLVTDDAAKVRIEAQHAALYQAGVQVNAKEQLFATGTRMADVGYSTQAGRKAEHDRKLSAREACEALCDQVKAEGREDIVLTARDVADSIHANGAITVNGYALGEQAIRGLAARIESPMLGYVLGLRDRMASRKRPVMSEEATKANEADRAKIAEVIRHECLANPGESFKLRVRKAGRHGKPDCYAIVGEGYSPADAPTALAQLADQLPEDARATFSYDVASTTWELRASVWTPTPVAMQAVGEAFEGYVSFSSKDNGTAKFRGGGGILLLRCLNASTYTADDSSVARVHRGRILYAVDRMLRKSLTAIDAITTAWGVNRNAVLEIPVADGGEKRITLEDAIPGFYMSMLRSKQSELVGVLPGRTKEHAAGLTKAFFAERRDETRLVRSDLAQGWTRYIQDQPNEVRRDAEKAIGDWLVNNRPVKCQLGSVSE